MIINIVNIDRVGSVEAKDDTSVGSNGDRPKPFQSALERMQTKSRHVHVRCRLSRVEPCEDIPQFDDVIGCHAPGVILLI